MKQFLILLLGFHCVALGAGRALAVEEPPLDATVVQTFKELRWPEWITGADKGFFRDPRPVVVTGAGDGSNRMFFATQYGAIFVTENNPQVRAPELFLDLRDRVIKFMPNDNEAGLLGLAFHPRFADNGDFFVYYTAKPTAEHPHQSVISRFRVLADNPSRADPASEEIILQIDQPYWNHNGGTLVFGPDGYLYIGLGDGGYWGDPHGHGQNLGTLLGSILRIDVDHRAPGLAYAIPEDNPFVTREDARGEIWVYGIRNVWRPTFDRETGAFWGADVGQDQWEEINLIDRGKNYGWNLREGLHPYRSEGAKAANDLVDPIWEYPHSVGKSITGGYVYRGNRVPALRGAFLYADYVTGQVWALWYDPATGKVTANRSIREHGPPVLTFGEDDDGEVYFASEREIFTFAPKAEAASQRP